VASAAERAGRRVEEIGIVAVTKRVPAEQVRAAVAAGAVDLGENYVQEARDKIPLVTGERSVDRSATPRWHFIGALQSNKARDAVRLFDLIQGVDSLRLAQEIGRQALKVAKVQAILIEVNLQADATARGGALPEAVEALAGEMAGIEGVSLRGLMAVAPSDARGEAARPHFRRLHNLFERLPEAHRQVLSMGMSGDFEVAVEEGATLVRIGTAIFGQRKV
jgi:pyridoxal phosphate enzyme (YggS family)